MKTLTRLLALVPKFWIWTSKIMGDLWLVDLFCPIKKISTLNPIVRSPVLRKPQHIVVFLISRKGKTRDNAMRLIERPWSLISAEF